MKKKTAGIVKVGAEITAAQLFGPAGTAVVKAVGAIAGPIVEHVSEKRARRAEEFVDNFMGSGYPSETATVLLEAEVRQAPDATKDAVYAALKELDDALSDRVVPTLAILAREYLRAGHPKDRFFIGMLRLLRDLSDAEHEGLRSLVRTVEEAWPEPKTRPCYVEKAVGLENALLLFGPNNEAPWHETYDALFYGLTTVGFATISTGLVGGKKGMSVEGAWEILREPWGRMIQLGVTASTPLPASAPEPTGSGAPQTAELTP
jgi:hypothetical protein